MVHASSNSCTKVMIYIITCSMSCVEKNASAQRRMVFATSYLPLDIPGYWTIVASFANQVVSDKSRVSPESAKVAMEKCKYSTMRHLLRTALTEQLIAMEYSVTKELLGVPLVPTQTKCSFCGGKLLLRGDRPSRMTLYTESMGTVSATHFHKYHNSRKGCHFIQFYGYSKSGTGSMHYDANWMMLPYFISSQEQVLK